MSEDELKKFNQQKTALFEQHSSLSKVINEKSNEMKNFLGGVLGSEIFN